MEFMERTRIQIQTLEVNWINYEIDHVVPVNAGGKDGLENFQFLSPNANRFVKCSMVYEQLLRRVDLSDALKERIRDVEAKEKNCLSLKWKDFIDLVEEIDKQSLTNH